MTRVGVFVKRALLGKPGLGVNVPVEFDGVYEGDGLGSVVVFLGKIDFAFGVLNV